LEHEKAERLVRYHRILRETPTLAGLACDYMIDDDELDDQLDCEEFNDIEIILRAVVITSYLIFQMGQIPGTPKILFSLMATFLRKKKD
jgi:flagellar biosynthesis component FlhA